MIANVKLPSKILHQTLMKLLLFTPCQYDDHQTDICEPKLDELCVGVVMFISLIISDAEFFCLLIRELYFFLIKYHVHVFPSSCSYWSGGLLSLCEEFLIY